MNVRHQLLIAVVSTAAVLGACADPGDNTLPPPGQTSASSTTGAGGAGTSTSTSTTSVTTTAGSGGAGGAMTGGGGVPMGAEADFAANVYPELEANCAPCHLANGGATNWLGSDSASTYALLKQYGFDTPSDCNILYKKGAHSGPPLTATADPKVVSWLEAEALENGLACNGNTGVSCFDALDAFQSCMYLEHWNATGMNDVQNQNTADGRCTNCHSSIQLDMQGNYVFGDGNVPLGENTDVNFEAHKGDPFAILKLVSCAYVDGQFVQLVPSLRYINKGGGECLPGDPNCHPLYNMNQNRTVAIQDFVSEIITALNSDTCDQLPGAP